MRNFDGKVAVVTGAARGIGYAIAERLSREGMRVVIADRDAEALARAEGALQAGGAQVVAVPVDVSRFEEVDRLPRAALAAFGSLDVVCLNAGVNAAHVPTWEVALEDWDWILGPNVWGVIHGIRAFVPPMLAQGGEGHIAITSSNGGLRMRPSSGPYPTTKNFVLALAESLHHDLRAAGSPLRVSALLPGAIRTREAMARRGEERVTRSDEQQDAEHREMPPEQVAEILLEAIREERFYVPTHPERSHAQVRARVASILEDRDPTGADRVL